MDKSEFGFQARNYVMSEESHLHLALYALFECWAKCWRILTKHKSVQQPPSSGARLIEEGCIWKMMPIKRSSVCPHRLQFLIKMKSGKGSIYCQVHPSHSFFFHLLPLFFPLTLHVRSKGENRHCFRGTVMVFSNYRKTVYLRILRYVLYVYRTHMLKILHIF